ncbi:hypothetical protein MTO96_051964 [Rhipicephalus appendiculatus]
MGPLNGFLGGFLDGLIHSIMRVGQKQIQIYDDELDDYVDLEPGTCVQNKAKIKLSRKLVLQADDSSHLIVYGETAESVERHNHWLQVNAASAGESDLRPRLLATAQARHEHLRSLTISEALVLFPFLASEASLLLEFDILFKKNIAEDFAKDCQQLCDAVLEYATDVEMTALTHAARDNLILATLEFVAGRCNEVLAAILLEGGSASSSETDGKALSVLCPEDVSASPSPTWTPTPGRAGAGPSPSSLEESSLEELSVEESSRRVHFFKHSSSRTRRWRLKLFRIFS